MNTNKYQVFFFYFTVFITGAVILITEILGARVIAPFFGSTIFVWSALIVVTLAALAFGYFSGGYFIDKYPSSFMAFLIIAVAAVFFPLIMRFDSSALRFADGLGIQWGPFAAAFLLFFVPLFLLGMLTPFMVRLLSESVERAGNISGRILGISTVGSIVGALFGVFILLPKYSLTTIFNGMGIVLLALSFFGILLWQASKKTSFFIILILFIAIWFAPIKADGKDAYTFSLIHEENSYYGNLKIAEVGQFRCILVDGATESCVDKRDFSVSPFFNKLANMINSQNGDSLLILGGGGGNIISGGIDPRFEIDFVDIDERVVQLSRDFIGFSPGENVNFYIDDARHFLSQNRNKYDIIFIDIAQGVNQPFYLFSAESFELIKKNLKEKGLVIFHVLGGVGDNDISFASILRTAKTIFPEMIQTTTNPDGNTSYFLYLLNNHIYSSDMYDTQEQKLKAIFPISNVNERRGVFITDDKNPFDFLFAEKYEVLIKETRNFGGLRTTFVK